MKTKKIGGTLKEFWGRAIVIRFRIGLFSAVWLIPIIVFVVLWFKNTDHSNHGRATMAILASWAFCSGLSIWHAWHKGYGLARFVGWVIIGFSGIGTLLWPVRLASSSLAMLAVYMVVGLAPQVLLPKRSR